MATRIVQDNRTRLLRQYERLADRMITKAAMDTAGAAKAAAPVDTGFLRNSIRAERVGRLKWRVVVYASYGIFVEFGTRLARAQPYLMPAYLSAVGALKKSLSRLGRVS